MIVCASTFSSTHSGLAYSVCVYVCLHAGMYVFAKYVCWNISCACMLQCVCMYVCMSVCVCVYACVYVCMYVYDSMDGMDVCTYVFTHVHMYMGMYVCMHVFVYACSDYEVCIVVHNGIEYFTVGMCVCTCRYGCIPEYIS